MKDGSGQSSNENSAQFKNEEDSSEVRRSIFRDLGYFENK